MKRILKLFADAALTAGCCIGVGFLSGKEAQLYWGNAKSAVTFAAAFAAATFVVREFCGKTHSATVGQTCARLLSKGAEGLRAAIVFCSFACAVTALAGVEACFRELFGAPLPFPTAAFAAAAVAAVLRKAKLKVFKAVNVLSLALAGATIGALFVRGAETSTLNTPAANTFVYALFSVTVTFGVSAKLSQNCTAWENATVSVLSALIVGALMIAVLRLCDFSASTPVLRNLSLPLKILAAAAILLSSVTGLVANVVPVTEMLNDVLGDETLCTLLTLSVALALSMFGLDFALRAGYAAVAAVGLFTLVLAIKKLAVRRTASKKIARQSSTQRE